MFYYLFSQLLIIAAFFICIKESSALAPPPPIAIHQLIVVNASASTLVRFKGFDTSNPKLVFTILNLPQTGQLFQLSKVFSDYGYAPIAGSVINQANTVVTGSQSRVYYKRPANDKEINAQWDRISFSANNAGVTSYDGLITFVSSSGILVGSDFLLSNEGWSIVNNKAAVADARFEQYSRNSFSNYIVGVDDNIKVAADGKDSILWYFQAPSKFYGNFGISYGGSLSFSLLALAGNIDKRVGNELSLVELECSECVGPVSKGIKLVFPISAVDQSVFNAKIWNFDILLLETSGWKKDSQNTLQPWLPVSQCDMIQVLSRLTKFRILGDWTSWYETIALDNVRIQNLQARLPLCAMARTDASVCTCK